MSEKEIVRCDTCGTRWDRSAGVVDCRKCGRHYAEPSGGKITDEEKGLVCEHSEVDKTTRKMVHCDLRAEYRVRQFSEREAKQNDGSWKTEPVPASYLCRKHFEKTYVYGKVPADGSWVFRNIHG